MVKYYLRVVVPRVRFPTEPLFCHSPLYVTCPSFSLSRFSLLLLHGCGVDPEFSRVLSERKRAIMTTTEPEEPRGMQQRAFEA